MSFTIGGRGLLVSGVVSPVVSSSLDRTAEQAGIRADEQELRAIDAAGQGA